MLVIHPGSPGSSGGFPLAERRRHSELAVQINCQHQQ